MTALCLDDIKPILKADLDAIDLAAKEKHRNVIRSMLRPGRRIPFVSYSTVYGLRTSAVLTEITYR